MVLQVLHLFVPEILSKPFTTEPAPFVICMLSTQVPGVKLKPKVCAAPLIDGMFS
jgi:hypothetical protein